MWSRAIIRHLTGTLTSFGRRLSAFLSGRRLMTFAALLHVTLAVGLFCAGRARIAPNLIDRDGIMASFAFDDYGYQRGAVRLVEILRQDGTRAWATEHEPLHVKLLSIQFALLGPLFGYSTLSAEPLNLLCYLAILALVLMLGREVGGRRVGLISAVTLALWPTFLLHTLQLLKDPLFIAGAIALVLCVTTWLTRTYSRSAAIVTGALMVVTILLLLLIRLNFGIFVFALVLLGFILLVVRELLERRRLYWGMLFPILALLAIGVLIPFMERSSQKLKQYPSDQGGQPKSVISAGTPLPTVVSYRPGNCFKEGAPQTYTEHLCATTDRAALRVDSVRSRFAAAYPEAGSTLDSDVEFRDFRALILYLPRAFEIGFWSPFPNTWVASGKRVGSAGRLISGAETLIIYVCELLALFAVLRAPRDLTVWLLMSLIITGVTALGLVVPIVGALYRFRYTFWVLLIILGVRGLDAILTSSERWLRAPGNMEAS
jgi:hypothetical protein